MKCRICGREMYVQTVSNVAVDVNRVYSDYTERFNSISSEFGFCSICKHGQLESDLSNNHYDEYNLLNVDNYAAVGGGSSPLRLSYYDSVLEKLSELCIDRNKLLDIGCGHGTVMELATNRFGIVKGVEPSRVEAEIARNKGLDVVCTYFDYSWTERDYSAFLSTQVWEHLPNPREAAKAAYQMLIPGGGGYIDVPNGYRIYTEGRYSDLYVEHINYWSVNSLGKLLNECGFYVTEIGEVLNGNHIAAYVKKPIDTELYDEKKRADIQQMRSIFGAFRNISVWGAGVKGRNFISTLLTEQTIKHLFDSNESLTSLYVGNCATQIERPTKETVCASDLIILTAIEYKNEIIATLKNTFNYSGAVVAIDNLTEVYYLNENSV